MATVTYECPACKSQTTTDDGVAPRCVPCEEDMVIVEPATPDVAEPEPPIAPANLAAYQDGLAQIEKAKEKATADEREYLRAKEYAGKAKKRLETSEADLRAVIGDVSERLRPRPLFEAADHHTDDELLTLLADLNVVVTLEKIQAWTDAEKQDARAWALAAHSEQPRLIPPFLWAPAAEADPEPPLADATAGLAAETPPEPAQEPAPEPEHRYPARVPRKRGRRATEPPEPADEVSA